MAGGLGMILRQADWSLLRLSGQLLDQLLLELVAGTLGELFRYLLGQLLE